MAYIHAVVTLKHTSGFDEDNVVNTFNLLTPDEAVEEPGEISFGLAAFYNGLHSTAEAAVSSYISGYISRAAGACKIELSHVGDHLDGSAAGPSFFEDTFTMGAAAGGFSTLPTEVASCLTLVGLGRNTVSPDVPDNADPSGPDDPGTQRDRPMQRRTGRIYVGPLQSNADNSGRPSAAFQADLLSAAQHAQDVWSAQPTGPFIWSVWSRTNATFYPVVEAFTDNAWDIQRRRGMAPTTRTTVSV